MTSKEMEARSGVARANIRYDESEGLLTPAETAAGTAAAQSRNFHVTGGLDPTIPNDETDNFFAFPFTRALDE